uniref:phage tail spike protein n=1 Tax=Jeotgalibaca porci TaxID=1868793 RepID=UPI0035A123F6
MITIHHEKETDFSKNGYGAIDDYIVNPNVGWELNGEFYASLEYPSFLEKASYLKNKNILRLPVPFMQDQLFRIYRTRKVLGFVQVEARHIFYDLLDNLIEDTNIVEKNGALALQQLLGATQYPHRFVGLSDIALSRTARMVRYNPVEALLDDSQANTFISRWGGELVRDNFTIRMAKQMGTDRGVHIQHKKDLTGYEATVDGSTVATRIMPTGFDGLRLPELYVDSPLLDPDNPKIKVIKYKDVKAAVGEYADDEDALPIEEAHSLLRQYAAEEYSVNHLDEPETVVSVNFVTLHNTKEYEEFAQLQEIQQGDVVKVSIPEEGFEITSRLVAFTSDPLQKNHYTSTTLGNHVLEFTTSNDEISKIRNEVNNLQDSIITVMQAANGKNRNFWGTADPNTLSLNANLGDNYTRTVGEEKILYQYVEVNGERYWSEILNTGDLDRVSREVKTAQAEAEAAKLAAEQTYTDSVAEAERIVEAQDLVYQALFEAVDNEVEQAQATANDAVNEINTAVQAAGFTTLNDTLKNQLTLANQAQQSANEAIADIGTTITELANTDTKASDALANAHVALGEVQRVEGIF